jgi:hypothetical protein
MVGEPSSKKEEEKFAAKLLSESLSSLFNDPDTVQSHRHVANIQLQVAIRRDATTANDDNLLSGDDIGLTLIS